MTVSVSRHVWVLGRVVSSPEGRGRRTPGPNVLSVTPGIPTRTPWPRRNPRVGWSSVSLTGTSNVSPDPHGSLPGSSRRWVDRGGPQVLTLQSLVSVTRTPKELRLNRERLCWRQWETDPAGEAQGSTLPHSHTYGVVRPTRTDQDGHRPVHSSGPRVVTRTGRPKGPSCRSDVLQSGRDQPNHTTVRTPRRVGGPHRDSVPYHPLPSTEIWSFHLSPPVGRFGKGRGEFGGVRTLQYPTLFPLPRKGSLGPDCGRIPTLTVTLTPRHR